MTQTLESIGNDALLAEVARRGLLTDLHGAVGALYDNLATNGVLDSESNATSYLAYRLRREDAKLSTNHSASRTASYWQQKIDAMDSEVERSTSPREYERKMMKTQVDTKSEQQGATLATEPLRLWCVMSPWNNKNSEEGTFEAKVWATDHDDACRALAVQMADCDDSGCETDEDRAKWVDEHIDTTGHLMVVLPVSEAVKDDIRELLEGPDGEFDTAAKADFDAIIAILAKR